jgi:hypothetical protein
MAVSLSVLLNDVSSRDAILQSLSEFQETLSEEGYSGNFHVSPGNIFSLTYMCLEAIMSSTQTRTYRSSQCGRETI